MIFVFRANITVKLSEIHRFMLVRKGSVPKSLRMTRSEAYSLSPTLNLIGNRELFTSDNLEKLRTGLSKKVVQTDANGAIEISC